MRPRHSILTLRFVFVALLMVIALVTSSSSLALRTNQSPGIVHNPQQITPTPEETDRSVPGSTDGIIWMGVMIAAIVLLPLLTRRALWRNGST